VAAAIAGSLIGDVFPQFRAHIPNVVAGFLFLRKNRPLPGMDFFSGPTIDGCIFPLKRFPFSPAQILLLESLGFVVESFKF
jgi:hypothetical protein